VELPHDMKQMNKESSKVDTPVGQRTMDVYTIEGKNIVYSASEMKLNMPAGSSIDIENALKNGVVGIVGESGNVLTTKNIQVGGAPAISARIKTKKYGIDVYVQYEQVLAKQAQYQLQVQATEEKTLDTPDVENYFSSLKINEEQPSAPTPVAPAAPAKKPRPGSNRLASAPGKRENRIE